MRLAALHLRVADPDLLAGFYRDVLGMSVRQEGANRRVGYDGQDADILLIPGGSTYSHDRGQRYWKIGITLPDVDLAAAYLRKQNAPVTEPDQFLDIGYMCHLTDTEGFVIELLQHDFKDNRPEHSGNATAPFAEARVGQITLRTGDITAEDAFWRAQGMSLLSIQEVEPYGFDLHFYGYTDETPPHADLWSVENREWLWKRSYTLLEFQHVAGAQFAPVPEYLGIEIEDLATPLSDAFGGQVWPG